MPKKKIVNFCAFTSLKFNFAAENPNKKRTMVFVKMKRTADVVSTFLNVNDLKSTTING